MISPAQAETGKHIAAATGNFQKIFGKAAEMLHLRWRLRISLDPANRTYGSEPRGFQKAMM
jgi:hypothetical protein